MTYDEEIQGFQNTIQELKKQNDYLEEKLFEAERVVELLSDAVDNLPEKIDDAKKVRTKLICTELSKQIKDLSKSIISLK